MVLPGSHFAVALAFFFTGAIGLVWVAPDIVAGLFPLPRVAAVTHLFTLGWITTSIIGALYQFLPVALGTPIRSERLAQVSLAFYAPGLTAFIVGILLMNHSVLLAGAAGFGTGLLLFICNLAATLRRAAVRDITWWALTGAAVSLFITVVLGSSLAGNLRWGYLADERFLAIAVHLHIAVAGWVLLTMAGVSRRLLPMFLLSHDVPERCGKAAVALLGGGVLALAVLHHGLGPLTTWSIVSLLGGGVIALAVQTALYFRGRRRPVIDPGMRLAAIAMAFLLIAVILAPFFVTHGIQQPRIATGYALALVLGGPGLFVAAHYYKILPFLIWLHRFGPLVGTRSLPQVADLYSKRLANLAGLGLAGGVATLLLATLSGAAWAARPAALLFALGASVLVGQMAALSLEKPR